MLWQRQSSMRPKHLEKTAIEPVFDLLSKRLETSNGAHKPLPVSGLAYVSIFLGLRCSAFTTRNVIEWLCGIYPL